MRVTSYAAGDPGDFSFNAETEARAKAICARYPEDRQASAIIPLLDLAQRQNDGWLSKQAIDYVANYLDVAPIRTYEVATFYTMFNLKPVGRHLIQVCRTTTCWARGSDDITRACLETCGIDALGGSSDDGLFTVMEVECLGACCNAPMVQINDDYYEDLTPERMTAIVEDLRAGRDVPVGPQAGRSCSAPEGGPKTLLEVPAGPDATGSPDASAPPQGEES